MRILIFGELTSTNSYLKSKFAELSDSSDYSDSRDNSDCSEPFLMVAARSQTAGRGQRGNSWESAPGENLTVSVAFVPDGVAPRDQFRISEAVALAVCDFLANVGVEAKVKWPNDIYVGDRKICGILIENSLESGRISRSIAGVGININQTCFSPSIPNPTSVQLLTGLSHDIPSLLPILADCLESRLLTLSDGSDKSGLSLLHSEFKSRCWRFDGEFHPFRRRQDNVSPVAIHAADEIAAGETFRARIADILPSGPIILELEDGRKEEFAFKQIEFLL